jgi:hypothetical protein
MLMERLEGRLFGNRGDRKGDAGAEVDGRYVLGAAGTLRLRFFAFRGRFGGEGERWEVSPNISSGIVVGDIGCQSVYEPLSRKCGAKGSGSIAKM